MESDHDAIFNKHANYFLTMATEAEHKQILDRLDEIKSELDYIKDHIIDIDAVLTDDDLASLDEAEEALKEGKTERL